MKFNIDTIQYFSSVLRYNVSTYVDLYSIFVSDYQKRIEDYYKSLSNDPDVDSFDFLESLISDSNTIDDLIKINKNSFNNISHWEFAAYLDEIKGNLLTVQNSAKWIGSNKSKNSWRSVSIQSEHFIEQNETLEKIVRDNYGGDSGNNWVDIAVRNNLMEKDYSVEGGTIIQLNRDISSQPRTFIRTVIDVLTGEKVYGLDLDKKIRFSGDDLVVKSYMETLKQSVLILSGIKRGHIPEFPYMGIDEDLGNLGQLIYSSIVRQMQSVFATDDTITDFNIVEIAYENSDLRISYTVDTFYNKSINQTITL